MASAVSRVGDWALSAAKLVDADDTNDVDDIRPALTGRGPETAVVCNGVVCPPL